MIPKMTNPLSKHWQQPKDIQSAPMDDKHVILNKRQIDELLEYSASVPSVVYDGKCWKWIKDNRKCLCWYYPSNDPDQCAIGVRDILELI